MRDLILAIETSNPGAIGPGEQADGPGVALGRMRAGEVDVLGVEVLRLCAQSPGGPIRGGHDDDLIPAIDRLFARTNVDRRTLARVGVSAGPGGYTGLRVACCAGKMIAEACGAACVSVPSSLVVLDSVPPELRAQGPVAIALASKGPSAWVQVFEREHEHGAGRLLDAGGLAGAIERGVSTIIADRHFPESMRAACSRAAITVLEPIFSARACLMLSARLTAIEPALLVPLYPREPDAVTLWRERRPAG